MLNVAEYDNITNDYNDITLINCTNFDDIIDMFIPTILLTIPCGLSFFCLMSLMVYTFIEALFNNKKREKHLYPFHPVRCIITGPSECGKSVF